MAWRARMWPHEGLAARGGATPLGGPASSALCPSGEGAEEWGLRPCIGFLFPPDISAFPQAVPSPDAADSTR